MKNYKLTKLKRLKIWFSSIIWKYFKHDYVLRKEKKLADKKIKEIKADFKKTYNLDPEHLRELMNNPIRLSYPKTPKNEITLTHDEYQEFLKNELKESAKLTNDNNYLIKQSLFWNPGINNIHNESLNESNNNIPLNRLIEYEKIIDQNNLIKQKNNLPELKLRNPEVANSNKINESITLDELQFNDIENNIDKFKNLKRILEISKNKL